ncbi:helix-turn-helix domain-containing protein [Kitasatospora sp. NPDC094011]|uniref:helix-turn-helix domain-containing protein n=1 Tax=Kitasatospora sp. NPDC094011 TaxID=3364090 RepID=UPI003817E968
MGRHHASEITTPSPADRLAGELQSLKSGSGLTYARLSERTHYAKSSWERWVNGKQFPPRDAVQSIASVCGGDAEQLLELWQLAESRRIVLTLPGAPTPGVGAAGAAPDDGQPSDGAPGHPERSGGAHADCPHRREAVRLRGLVLFTLAVGAGGVLAAAGRRNLRREI